MGNMPKNKSMPIMGSSLVEMTDEDYEYFKKHKIPLPPKQKADKQIKEGFKKNTQQTFLRSLILMMAKK